MGGIYNDIGQFDEIVQDGLENKPSWSLGIRSGNTRGTFNLSVASTNPQVNLSSPSQSRNGSLFPALPWGSFESNANGQQIDEHEYRVELSSGNRETFVIISGYPPNNFDSGINFALEVDTSTKEGAVDLIRPGLAEVILKGLSNRDIYYALIDGTGTTITSFRETVTAAALYEYNNQTFDIASNMTFENQSGAAWDIEEVQVRVGTGGPVLMKDESISATVDNGLAITFSELSLTVSGLS